MTISIDLQPTPTTTIKKLTCNCEKGVVAFLKVQKNKGNVLFRKVVSKLVHIW